LNKKKKTTQPRFGFWNVFRKGGGQGDQNLEIDRKSLDPGGGGGAGGWASQTSQASHASHATQATSLIYTIKIYP